MVKAFVARFTKPEIAGRVEVLRLDSGFNTPMMPRTEREPPWWLLAYVHAVNHMPQETTVRWDVVVDMTEGWRESLPQAVMPEDYWSRLREEHRPKQRVMTELAFTTRFERNIEYEGWLCFALERRHAKGIRFTIVGTDSVGRKHPLEPCKNPLGLDAVNI